MEIAAAFHSTRCQRSRFDFSIGTARLVSAIVSLLVASAACFGQSGAPGAAPPQGAAQPSATNPNQSQTAIRDVAGAQLAQFFRAANSREIQGDPLTLERVLYGVYSPAERYRRLAAYWDLAGKNATYNLCVACGAYAEECAKKIEDQGGASQETQAFLTAARQVARERQSSARLVFLQSQYDFDAAFTSNAGRAAAMARAAAKGGEAQGAARGVVFYIPEAKPATGVYQTRYAAISQYRTSFDAARLDSMLPLLYESLQTRANQAARELDALVALVRSPQVAESALFDSLDRYREAQKQAIDAAVRYNQAIAAYACSTVPASVQGAAFLAAINQSHDAEAKDVKRQSPTQNASPGSGAPPQNAPGSQGAAPRPAPQSPAPPRASLERLPGASPDDAPTRGASTENPIVAKPSGAADSQAASLASIRELAPTPLASTESNPVSAAKLHDGESATFKLVGYSRANQPANEQPANEQPANEQPANEQPANEQPATEQPATEQPATEQPATEQPATEQPATEQPATEHPATEQPANEQPATEQPANEQPGGETVARLETPERPASPAPQFPIVVVATRRVAPVVPDVVAIPVEADSDDATFAPEERSLASPDGAFFKSDKTEPDDELALDDGDLVVRGQEIGGDFFDAPPAAPVGAAPQTAPTAETPRPSSADSQRVRELTNALFAVESPRAPRRDSDPDERLCSLHEVALRANQSAAGRYAAARAFWKLQGACARERVERTVFQNYSVAHANLARQVGESADSAKSCLAVALRQQARVVEAESLKRAAQIDLLAVMGLSPDGAAYPLPASLPYCGARYDLGSPASVDARLRRAAAMIRERAAALQDFGAALDPPARLLNVDVANISEANLDACVATLEKKREAALLFVDDVVALNFSIAEYVAFFPSRATSDQFADAALGRAR